MSIKTTVVRPFGGTGRQTPAYVQGFADSPRLALAGHYSASYALESVLDAFTFAAIDDVDALEDIEGTLAKTLEAVRDRRREMKAESIAKIAADILIDSGEFNDSMRTWSAASVLNNTADYLRDIAEGLK